VQDRLPVFPAARLIDAHGIALPAHIKPARAAPAVPRNSAKSPHQRIAPGAWTRKHDVLPETPRAAQFAGHEMYRFTDNHYPEV